MFCKVSIIIAAFNEEKNIDRCFKCLIKIIEYIKNIEVIVIDDGSKDRTYELCKFYEKDNDQIRVFHQKNKGVSVARNLGIAKSKGEWIMFLDADDYLIPQNTIDFFESALKLNANIVQGGLFSEQIGQPKFDRQIYSESSYFMQKIALNQGKYWHNYDDYRKLLKDSVQGACGKLYRKEYIYKFNIRFIEDLALGEDLLFYLNVLEYCEEILFINIPIYCIVENPNSTTRFFNKKLPDSVVKFTYKINEFANKNSKDVDFYNDMYYQIYNHFYYGVIKNLYFHKNELTAIEKKEILLSILSKKQIHSALISVKSYKSKDFKYLLRIKIPVQLLLKNRVKCYLYIQFFLKIMITIKKRIR